MRPDQLERWAAVIERLVPFVIGRTEAESLDNAEELAEVAKEMRHEALEARLDEIRGAS